MNLLRVDVADLLARPSARRAVQIAAAVPGLAGSGARVPDDEPVELDLVLERIPDGIVVRGALRTRWEAQCGLCLADLRHPASLLVRELFEPDPLEGDTYPLEGHEVDLEQLVRDTVVLELPLAPTCATAGGTECAREPVRAPEPQAPDPRWAALSRLELRAESRS
jgi:uncharacterized protein